MGRPRGSKNKPRTASSASGARKAGKTPDTLSRAVPTNFADTSLGASAIPRGKARAKTGTRTRGRSGATPKPDWSTLRFGILLGETKAIKKAFATQEDALGYVKSLPVAKQSKAKLVTVQALKVETSISILPVHTGTIEADLNGQPSLKYTAALQTRAARSALKPAPKPAAKPAAAPAAKTPEAPAVTGSGGSGDSSEKSKRLTVIAERAAKLGHSRRGAPKAVAVTAQGPDEDPEENAPDLFADAE